MSRNSFRTMEEALAVEARLKKREAFKRAEAEAAAVPAKGAAKKRPAAGAGKNTGGAGEVRIIGGQWRRTRLAVAQRPGLRPTPDRVRETLFNWLGQELGGWRCLDVFAGTGALGFEAASRGAQQVRMVEQDAGLAQQLERITNNSKPRAFRCNAAMVCRPCSKVRPVIGMWSSLIPPLRWKRCLHRP